jgi:hypothetical protein
MANSYVMNVRIEIGTDPVKEDAVKNAIVQKLQDAKTAGSIDSATWTIQETPIVEGGKI